MGGDTQVAAKAGAPSHGLGVVAERPPRSPGYRFEPGARRRQAEPPKVPAPGTNVADQALTIAAAAVSVAAPTFLAVGAPVPARFAATMGFICLAPGVALIRLVRGRMEVGLVVAVSLAATALLAQSMLWLNRWQPKPFLYGFALVCLLALLPRLPRVLMSATAGVRRIRLSRERFSGSSAGHATLLAVALGAWGVSLGGANLNRMGGFGLLDAVPPTYFVALALLLIGFSYAISQEVVNPKLLALYVLALVLVLYGTIPLLYDQPRFPWSYKHFGVVELISSTGTVRRSIDIYNNWPAFFAANAWLSSVTGLAPISYATGSQLFFNLANAAAVLFAVRGATSDKRLQWTATWLFLLGNWVQPTEEDLAPQAFAFVISLVVLGLCLRCRGDRGLRDIPPLRWLDRVLNRISSTRPAPISASPSPVGTAGAVAFGAICFISVVVSHQLSPVMLLLSVAVLVVLTRRVPMWVLGAMIAIEAWWLGLAWPFLSKNYLVVDPGLPGAAPTSRNAHAALPHAALSFYAPAAVGAIIIGLALVGGIRRIRAGHRDVIPAGIIVAVPVVAVVQAYGGNGLFRAFLFILPWLAFFGAAAFGSVGPTAWLRRWRWPLLAAVTSALAACLLVAVYGQDLGARVSTDEVQAETWLELHGPPGTTIVNGDAGPVFLTRRYPLMRLEGSLLDHAEFTGRGLQTGGVSQVARFFQHLRPSFQQFLVLSKRQDDFARLNGILPSGSLIRLARQLERSNRFRLVFRRPSAWVFQYVSPPARRRRMK